MTEILDPILGSQFVFLQYPNGAGGNYIAALCALSRGCEFRHCALIDFFDNTEEKFEFLLNYLKNYRNPWWEDFQMGNDRLFGHDIRDQRKFWHLLQQGQAHAAYEFCKAKNTLARRIYESEQKFFMVSHSMDDTRVYSTLHHMRAMIMVNNLRWITYRVDLPPDAAIAMELETLSEQSLRQFQSLSLARSKFYFDTDALFNIDIMVNEMRRVYTWLELEDFCPDWIAQIHEQYLNVIEFCRSRQQQAGLPSSRGVWDQHGPGTSTIGLVL